MPRATLKIPSYRLHQPSGHAVVTLSGREEYLGLMAARKATKRMNASSPNGWRPGARSGPSPGAA
jgi:hypothetical protein